MKSTTKPASDRRVHERHDLSGHIVVGRPTKGTILAGTILNLSIGGCLMKLRAPSDLKPDAILEVRIHAGNLNFCTLGTIRRYETDVSMIGIEFLNLGLEGRRTLRALIAGFKASQNQDQEPTKLWAVPCLCEPTALDRIPLDRTLAALEP